MKPHVQLTKLVVSMAMAALSSTVARANENLCDAHYETNLTCSSIAPLPIAPNPMWVCPGGSVSNCNWFTNILGEATIHYIHESCASDLVTSYPTNLSHITNEWWEATGLVVTNGVGRCAVFSVPNTNPGSGTITFYLTYTNIACANRGIPFTITNTVTYNLLTNVTANGPTNQTVCPGATATFNVTASGTGPITYVWRFGDTILTGETTNSLSITNVTFTNAGTYSVTVSGACGSVSNSATLTVLTNLSVFGPTNLSVCAGSTAVFEATASGSEPISYIWWFGTNAIPGATSSSLTITNVSAGDAGTYVLMVSGPCGSQTNEATLTVLTNLSALGPTNQTVCAGSTAVFEVTASGSEPISYIWWFGTNVIPGATSSSLTITNVGLGDAGTYAVVVSSPCGTQTNEATLTVLTNLSVLGPWSLTNCLGETSIFSVSASGGEPITYQWMFETNVLEGQTDSTLSVTNTSWTNAGSYWVIVTGPCGSVTSSVAVLTVIGIDRVIIDGSNPEMQGATTNVVGTTHTLRAMPNPVTAVFPGGSPAWVIVSQPAESALSTNLPGGVTVSITPTNAGQYLVRATCGASSADFTITCVGQEDPDYDAVSSQQELLDGTDPFNPDHVVPYQLGAWKFDSTNWAGVLGQLPLTFTNLMSLRGVSGNAVLVNTNPAAGAWLIYGENEANWPIANINCRKGTVSFWFKPEWSSGITNGTGPTNDARLIEVGTKGSTDGCWGLYLGNRGTNIYFCTQTNATSTLRTNLQWAINWTSNNWRHVALTYSPTNSRLYIDGQLVVTNGLGVTNWPDASVRANGFAVGSAGGGTNQARGRFDNLNTANYLRSPEDILYEVATTCFEGMDVMLVMDRSGSMTNSPGKFNNAKAAGSNFVQRLDITEDQVGLASFASKNDVKLNQMLTTNRPAVLTNLYGLIAGGWTRMDYGITTGRVELASVRHNPGSLPVMVLLSDGLPNDGATSNSVMAAANAAKTNAVRIISIALGSDADTSLMRQVATSTNLYYYADQSDQLEAVFTSISGLLCRNVTNPPTVQIISPTNGQVLDRSIAFPVKALASDPKNALVGVRFYADSTYLGLVHFGAATNDGAIYTLHWPPPAPGTYVLTAVATNVYGLSVTSAPVTVSVISSAPTVVINVPHTNDSFVVGTNILIVAEATDADGTIDTVQFTAGDVPLGYGVLTSNNLYYLTWSNVPPTYPSTNLFAIATDNDGLSATSAPVNILVSSTLAVQISQPTNGTIYVAPAAVPIAAIVAPPGGASRVEFYANDGFIGQDATSTGNPYSFTWVGVPVGDYELMAKAFDFYSGSVTSAVISVSVVPPVDVDPGPSRVVSLTNGTATIAMNGTVTGGVSGGVTSLWSQIIGPATFMGLPSTNLNAEVTFNRSGNYLFLLVAGDGYSWDSDVMSVTVSSNRPPIVDAGPNRIIASGASASLNGSVTDDGFPQPPSLTSWWEVISPTNLTLTFSNANAPVTTVTNFPTNGVYVLRLNATDGMDTSSSDMIVTVADPSSRTYTFDADFAEGELVNVNFDDIPNQLQLNQTIEPFPFVWVPCSARGTVVRIDANTGQILGEYRSGPETITGASPSRTTVDRFGNCWVANRSDGFDGRGSIARIGVVIGGTRGWIQTNEYNVVTNFVADQRGDHLQPPFKYCTAVDRDTNGYIRTSCGLGNILDWDTQLSGTNNFGGVSLADDECIINYTRVTSQGTRTIAIDASNDLWVGGHHDYHEKVSGITGQIISGTAFKGISSSGGYGGLIDGDGVLWSANGLFRFDISRRFDMSGASPAIIDLNYVGEYVTGNYGIGIDPVTGNIWCSVYSGGSVIRVSPNGSQLSTFDNPQGGSAGGIAVDDRGNVWVASHSGGNYVAHFRTDGTFVGNIDLGCPTNQNVSAHGPTGVAVDVNGKVWCANYGSHSAMRIDPNRGPRMLNGELNSMGYLLGAPDLTVSLNAGYAGETAAQPYNYSDMTGFVSLGATKPSGIWRVVHDGGVSNQIWGVLKWTSSEPPGTEIQVEARATDDYLQLSATNNLFRQVTNGVPFSGVSGRYMEIRAVLSHKTGTNATPVLYDLTVSSGSEAVIAATANFANSDRATLFENSGPHVLRVLTNDIAPAGTTLTITKVSPPASGSVKIGVGATNLIYTPNTNFFGIDRFSYTASDGQGGVGRAVVTVAVGQVIPAPSTNYFRPVAVDDLNRVVIGNSSGTFINVLANDFDTNAPPHTNVFLRSVIQPAHGYARMTSCGITYIPNRDYFGPDQFTYTIRNEYGLIDSAKVTLTVTGSPIIPIGCGTVTNRTLTTNNSAISRLYSPSYYKQAYTFTGDPGQAALIRLNDAAYSQGVSARLFDHAGNEVAYAYSGSPISYVPRDTNVYTLEVLISTSTLNSSPGVSYTLTNNCVSTNLPHMAVLLGTNVVLSGGGIDFGVTHAGFPVSGGLTITNYGTADLTVWWYQFNPSTTDFTLTDNALTNGSILVAAQSSTNFTLRFEARQPGAITNVVLSFNSDDGDYSYPYYYDIHLTARANPTNTVPPAVGITNPLPDATYVASQIWNYGYGISITATSAPAAGAEIWAVNFYAQSTNGNLPIYQDFTPDGYGNYTFDNWYGVPPGNYNLTAVAIDDSGLQTVSAPVPINVVLRSASSPEMKVLFFGTNDLPNDSTIDFGLVPPNVPSRATLLITNLGPGTLNISGLTPSANFYLTNHPQPPFSLAAHTGTNLDIAFRAGTHQKYDGQLVFSGNDEGLFGPFNDNQTVGNLRIQLTATVTNSGLPPTVVLTSPASNAVVIGSSILLKAGATNNSGTSIDYVDFYATTTNGTYSVGREYYEDYESGLYEITWSPVSPGEYLLFAVAVDYGDGLATVSAPVPITVQARPATSPVLQVLFFGTNALGDNATIVFPPTAAGDSNLVTLTLSNAGNASLVVTNLAVTADYNGDFTLSTAPSGTFTILAGDTTNLVLSFNPAEAHYYDENGSLTITNGDIARNPLVISLRGHANPAASVPPSVAITNPLPNATFTSAQTYAGQISLTATSSLPAGATYLYVDFYATDTNGNNVRVGGNSSSTPEAGVIASWSGSYGVAAGGYTLTAVAWDENGLGGISAPVPITILERSAASPYMKVLFFGTNDLANDSTINFGIAPTNTPVEVNLVITNLGPGTLTNDLLYLPTGYHFTNDTPEGGFVLAPGEFTNVTVVFNSASVGQPGGQLDFDCNDDGQIVGPYNTGLFRLNLTGIATNLPPAPTVALTNPTEGAVFIFPAPIVLGATAAAANDGWIQRVDFYATSVARGNVYLGTDSYVPYSYEWQNAPAGDYTLTAVAVDYLGRATASSPIHITVLNRPTTSPIFQAYLYVTNDLPNGSTLDFGLTQVGSPIIVPITVSNTGNAVLNISKFIFSNTNSFSLTNSFDLPLVVQAGASMTLDVEYNANASGEATNLLTIYNNDVATHPFYLTNIGRANPVNGTPPTAWLTAPIDGTHYAFPADIPMTAVAFCASNSTLWGINYYATTPSGPVQIGQVLADAGQTNLVGMTSWSRPAPGTYTLSAIAVDRSGLMGQSTNTVQITITGVPPSSTNLPPVARDDQLIIQGVVSNVVTYSIPVIANDSDPNQDPLTLTSFIHQGSLGQVIQVGNELRFTPNPLWFGTNWVFYTISDGRGGTASAQVKIVVLQTPLPTVELVTPESNEYIELPLEPEERVLPLVAFAQAPGTNGIVNVKFYDQEQLLGTVTSGDANLYTFMWELPPSGYHLISAIALDTVGQENITPGAYIYIAGNPNNHLPTAAITNLAEILEVEEDIGFTNISYPIVTNGILEVLGNARDENDLSDVISYQVLLYKPDGTFIANITPGATSPGYFHPGTDENGVLTTNVDLTLFENGAYDLVLNVSDGWDVSSDVARILLNSQLKIGNFSFSVQDVTLPVSGMPLTVTRTYNSLNRNKSDFGYSWTYAINDVNLELDEIRQDVSDLSDWDDRYSLRVGGGRDVTLTLPDGRRVTFQFYLDGPHSCGYGWDPYCYDAKYKAPPGVNYTLEPHSPYGGTPYYNAVSGYWDNAAGTGFDQYDFSGFTLTGPDGTQYIINREDEGEHFYGFGGEGTEDFEGVESFYVNTYGKATLTSIIQPSGDSISIRGDQIDHYDPTGNLTRSIRFERDDQGRITAVRDPNSDTNGLPVVKYVYEDPVGNLAEVQKLVDRDTGRYESTYYLYTNANFPHFITDIIDARGVRVAKTYYDDDGLIRAVEDADGQLTQFVHDLDGRMEIIVDRSGHTNTFVYDLRGNVVASTNALGVVKRMSYDEGNHLKTQTNAFGTSQETWTLYSYDGNGNQTEIVTSPNHTNLFLHDSLGHLLSQTDPLGNVTSNRYDNLGNLTNTMRLDTNGVIIQQSSSIYDEDARLVATLSGNGQTNASFAYDGQGNLTATTDAKGVTRTFGYDANGNQTSSSYDWMPPGGGSPITVHTGSEYDAAGRVSMTIDGLGNTNRTFYNTLGKMDYTVDKFGNTNRFLYNARGNLIQSTDHNGTYTQTVYDDNARPILTTDRNGVTGTRTYYDAEGRATNTARLTGARIRIEPDPNNVGQKRSVIELAGTAFSSNVTEYLPSGWVKSRTGADGQKTTYDYYPDGQTKSVTDALTNTTFYAYDIAGRQESIVNALNRTNYFEFDGGGRLVKTIFANNSYTSNYFNALGQRTVVRDQAGLLTQFGYDASGQLTNVLKPEVPNPENSYAVENPNWSYQYDQYGRLTVTTDPKGRSTTNTFDEFGRQVTRHLPLGQTETNIYNALGQLWKRIDFKGQTNEFVYDRFGRVKAKFYFAASASYPSNAVCYLYNQLGQLSKIIERSGVGVTTNTCNGYAALIALPGEGGGGLFASLGKLPKDVQGGLAALLLCAFVLNCIPRQRRREFMACVREAWVNVAQASRLQVEVASRRRLRLPSNGWRFATVVTVVALIGCDPAFDRLWTANAACTIPANTSTETERITEFSYDVEGRLAQVNSPEGVINYGYDLATGRHTSTCTKNSEVAYGYDELGRLKTVTVLKRNGTTLGAPETTTYTYTKVGSRETVTLPNGVVTTWRYDELNRLTNVVHQFGTTNLAIYSYQLHSTGRRTNATEVLRQEDGNYLTNAFTWAYDGLYRLTNEVHSTSATGNSYTNAYEYDLNGNRVKKTSGSETITYTHNANDQLTSEVSSASGTTAYTYDANGSLTSKSNANGTVTYTYNLMNKLSSVTAGASTTSYVYNDQGIRVRSSMGGTPKLYLVDGNNHTGYAQVLEELTALGGTPTMSYVLGDDVLAQATSAASYFLYDGHGSTRQLVSASGEVTSRYNYDAYGVTLGTSSASPETSLLYCGEQYDSTLAMYNLRARYYNPSNGRFNAMDSFMGYNEDPQSLHKYAYAHCDPVNGTDPTGNMTFIETSITMAIIAVVAALLASAISIAFDMADKRVTAVEMWSNALMAFGTTLLSFLCWPVAIIALIVGIYSIVKKALSEEGLSDREKWMLVAYLTLALIVSMTIRNPALATKIAAERQATAAARAYAKATKDAGDKRAGVAAAVEPENLDTTYLGHSGNPKPESWHPELKQKMEAAKLRRPEMKWDPENCAEAKAANAALKDGKDLTKLKWCTVRPRTGKFQERCPHCRELYDGATFTSDPWWSLFY